MVMLFVVVGVVSGALVLGAIWGLYGKLPDRLEGFLIALAGGALIVSAVGELLEPSIDTAGLWLSLVAFGAGGVGFAVADWFVDEKMSGGGSGLLASITLDGLPENLALGVALIGAGPLAVAAIAGSILLSNLPEAAGGAKRMASGDDAMSKPAVLGLWAATAGLLSVAAILGNLFLEGVPDTVLAAIRCLAAGAVVGSIATEVFPKAYAEDHHVAAVATTIGVAIALALAQLGG